MRKVVFCIIFFLAIHSVYAQKDWRLAVQTWTFHKYSFLESVDKADSLGIRYLEVYPGQKIGGTIPGVFSYQLGKDERDKIRQYLRYKNMQVIAIGVVDKYYYTKGNLEDFFSFARYMGISYITAEPEWEDLDAFNRLAIKYNVKVALHCHPKPESHYWHPDSMLLAMKGRPAIGAWPDLGHWARSAVPVVEGLRKMKGKLWGMHFKDIRAFDQLESTDTIFGKGVCDLTAVMKEMKRQGFKGVVSMEYESHENDNMKDLAEGILFYDRERRALLKRK